jgi:hypothetical protein
MKHADKRPIDCAYNARIHASNFSVLPRFRLMLSRGEEIGCSEQEVTRAMVQWRKQFELV